VPILQVYMLILERVRYNRSTKILSSARPRSSMLILMPLASNGWVKRGEVNYGSCAPTHNCLVANGWPRTFFEPVPFGNELTYVAVQLVNVLLLVFPHFSFFSVNASGIMANACFFQRLIWVAGHRIR
jgi:hypothetical protein